MSKLETTKMSSKGQVVIPENVRSRLGLEPGEQFVVVGDNDVVILKRIAPPSMREFDDLVARAEAGANRWNEALGRSSSRQEGPRTFLRIVLDTNVFVSAVFFGGIPGRILNAWTDGDVTLVTSPEIPDEYRRTGDRLARGFPNIDLHPIIALVAGKGVVVDAPPLSHPVCTDPDDDMFIACALASSAAIESLQPAAADLFGAVPGFGRLEVRRVLPSPGVPERLGHVFWVE